MLFRSIEAGGFYTILIAATFIGVLIDFSGADPMRTLLLAAIVNGVISVPIMVVMMRLSSKPAVMGPFVVKRRLRLLGWLATLVMTVASLLMFALML